LGALSLIAPLAYNRPKMKRKLFPPAMV